METVTRVSSFTILPPGKPIFDENATTVRVEDDAAGPFLVIEQCSDAGNQKIRLCFTEIDTLHDAMSRLRDEWENE
jgi:hypothetical protein